MSTLYEATATAWGGRDGRVSSSDDRVDLNLSIPKGMGGDDGPGTNPEQLFAAGYAACFHSALKALARAQKVDVTDSAVSVTVGVTGGLAQGIDLAVTIEAQLPGVEEQVARGLLDAAHQACPYSRATRGNVAQDVRLVTDED
ncbi:organic hydroperoxide resistance protein [Kineococcus sp. TBRC 1896]|uniref:Organic hydroperoxide resistance protein n=1 Tax=Kineococcus mangrovi TaxID=1660183 RepID=A0ABV4HYE9_9ACTN